MDAADADIKWHNFDTDVRGRRIAVHVDPGAGMPVAPEIRAAVLRAANTLSDAGAEVVELTAFIDDGVLCDIDDFWRIRFWRTYLGPSHEAKIAVLPAPPTGRTPAPTRPAAARSRRTRRSATCRSALSPRPRPTTPCSPRSPRSRPSPPSGRCRGGFDASEAMSHIAFTLPHNMSGQPASSANCGFTADGRPIGLQISGRRFADLETLQLTAWYEGARPVEAMPVFPG